MDISEVKMGKRLTHGDCFFDIDVVFLLSSGPTAGEDGYATIISEKDRAHPHVGGVCVQYRRSAIVWGIRPKTFQRFLAVAAVVVNAIFYPLHELGSDACPRASGFIQQRFCGGASPEELVCVVKTPSACPVDTRGIVQSAVNLEELPECDVVAKLEEGIQSIIQRFHIIRHDAHVVDVDVGIYERHFCVEDLADDATYL